MRKVFRSGFLAVIVIALLSGCATAPKEKRIFGSLGAYYGNYRGIVVDRESERSSVIVLGSVPNSSAQRAGLRCGDAIRSLNGRKVDSVSDVVSLLGSLPINSQVNLKIARPLLGQKKDTLDFAAKLAPTEESEDAYETHLRYSGIAAPQTERQMEKAFSHLAGTSKLTRWKGFSGLYLADAPGMSVDPDTGLPRNGVVIASAMPESPAEQAGLRCGDVIYAIDGKAVHSVAEAVNLLSSKTLGSMIDLEIGRPEQDDNEHKRLNSGEMVAVPADMVIYRNGLSPVVSQTLRQAAEDGRKSGFRISVGVPNGTGQGLRRAIGALGVGVVETQTRNFLLFKLPL
jgi:uncharacterized protein YceK